MEEGMQVIIQMLYTGVKKIHITYYYPKCNGLVER